MPLPSEIQIVPLDFDTIRRDLKRYLQNQTLFQDYNFEGSTISTLIDVLAYDAYYHGWYTNFAVNEVFLHTAQIRNSVVSAARQLGYIPRSISSAIAQVDVVCSGLSADEGTVNLPRYTPFTTTTGAGTFTYYNVQSLTARVPSGSANASFVGVELYEGVKVTQTFEVTSTNYSTIGTRLVLPNQDIDTRTLTVSVRPSVGSAVGTLYSRVDTLLPVTSSSQVFFLWENNDGVYEIQFGDDRLGKNVQVGQEVVVEYLVSRGADGNGAGTFTFAGNLSSLVGTTAGVTVSVSLSNQNIPSFGGASRESIESIKKNAPNLYQTQGRIVTPTDARTILLSEYSGIDSISVWGGEENDPPNYGKMYLSLKPINGERFGTAQQEVMLSRILRPKSLPTIAYEFVDPDYLYVVIDTEVRYSPALTSRTQTQLAELVNQAIINYTQTNLGQFGSVFRHSQVARAIDGAEQSIVSNTTTVQMEKRVRVSSSVRSYELNFANPIFASTPVNNLAVVTSRLGSQRFSHRDRGNVIRTDCYIENSAETMHIYRDDIHEGKVLVRSDVGTVDFDAGKVTLRGISILGITTNYIGELVVRAIPRIADLRPQRAQILISSPATVGIRMVPDLLDRTMSSTGRLLNGGVTFA
jgi:hypothetical protein